MERHICNSMKFHMQTATKAPELDQLEHTKKLAPPVIPSAPPLSRGGMIAAR